VCASDTVAIDLAVSDAMHGDMPVVPSAIDPVIEPDDLVGIELERSEWMVIGILGIIKSGGAYVPIDPEYPEQRKSFLC
jgi:non-ribosomal peptide synthetase component F